MLRGRKKGIRERLEWNKDQLEAFKSCKNELAEITFRFQPNFDKQFILTTDCSNECMGGVLSQLESNGQKRIIHVFSKTLDATQRNYSIIDKELLAMIKSMDYFRHYLIGKKFILETDHKSLKYLNSTSQPNSRIMRWSLFLHSFAF